MATKDLLKILEEEYAFEKQLLEKEREKAYQEWRKALGQAGLLASGAGAKKLAGIEEAYSRALGEITRQYTTQRALLKVKEAEEKKQKLGALLQGALTLAGIAVGLAPIGTALGGAVAKALGGGKDVADLLKKQLGKEISPTEIEKYYMTDLLKKQLGLELTTGIGQLMGSVIGSLAGITSPTAIPTALAGVVSPIASFPTRVQEMKMLQWYEDILRGLYK